MQLIAHRGFHRDHPENTLAAFAAAVELGVTAIETDLRLAAGGQVVLVHDRFAGEFGVESLTPIELSGMLGYPVPTLADALDAFPQVHWILELKTPAVLGPTLDLLAPLAGTRKLTLISFWHGLIMAAAERVDIDLGLSLGNSPLGFSAAAEVARARQPRINTLVWNYEFLDVEMLGRLRASAWRSLVFNTVTPADDQHCLALGVDGLITDRPEAFTASGAAGADRGRP